MNKYILPELPNDNLPNKLSISKKKFKHYNYIIECRKELVKQYDQLIIILTWINIPYISNKIFIKAYSANMQKYNKLLAEWSDAINVFI